MELTERVRVDTREKRSRLREVIDSQVTLPHFYLFLIAFVVLVCSSAVAIKIPLSVVVYPLYVVVFLLRFHGS